jgi:hypothetical protein
MLLSSVVPYWSSRHGSGDRILVKPKFPFLSYSHHVVILYYPKNCYTKAFYFPKIFYHTSLYGPIASGASVDPTSQVCWPAMLVLTIVGNFKVRFQVSPQLRKVHTTFH